MKFIAILFFVILSNHGDNKSPADTNFTLSGTVVEEATGDVLAGVTVKITGLDREIFTDLDGKFYVSGLKPGNYNLEISCLSYSTTEISGIRLDPQHNLLLVSLK